MKIAAKINEGSSNSSSPQFRRSRMAVLRRHERPVSIVMNVSSSSVCNERFGSSALCKYDTPPQRRKSILRFCTPKDV